MKKICESIFILVIFLYFLTDSITITYNDYMNIGYLFLQKLYHDLEISSFFRSITAGSRITFDPNLVNRFLTFARILEPDSAVIITLKQNPKMKTISMR